MNPLFLEVVEARQRRSPEVLDHQGGAVEVLRPILLRETEMRLVYVGSHLVYIVP